MHSPTISDGFYILNMEIKNFLPKQWYKKFDSGWVKTVQELEASGRDDWVNHCKNTLGAVPIGLDPDFKVVVEHMYTALTNEVTGRQWFPDSMRMDEVVTELKKYNLG